MSTYKNYGRYSISTLLYILCHYVACYVPSARCSCTAFFLIFYADIVCPKSWIEAPRLLILILRWGVVSSLI